jgi:Tol biopolymer transport system component
MLVAVLGAVALLVPAAAAEAPTGPRLTFVRASGRKLELVTTDPAGANPQVIAGGRESAEPLPFIFSAPSWSADGTRVAFVGMSQLETELRTDIYLAAADGSDLARVPGTREALYPVLAPDGQSVAFVRERQGREGPRRVASGNTIWLAPVGGGRQRKLVPWHPGAFSSPSSFAPDGSTLAITLDRRESSMAVALSLTGAGRRVIARDAIEPVYSPDGTRVALLTVGRERTVKNKHGTITFTPTELAVADADGSDLRRLTRTPHALELQASWDPSGEQLAYSHFPLGLDEASVLGIGDSLMEINADGSCRHRFLSIRGTILFGATWQPGPGREAGPISC